MSGNAFLPKHPRAGSLWSRWLRCLAIAGIMLLIASVMQLVAMTPAHAEEPPGGIDSYSDMVLYAYADAGETVTVTGGPFTVEAPDGASSTNSTSGSTYTATSAGIWKLTGPNTGTGGTYNWTVSVAASGSEVPGRVWSDRYLMRQSSASDLKVYLLGRSGYRYDVTLDDYMGINSTILATPFGNVNDQTECAPLYRSVDSEPESPTSVTTCAPYYHVFFNEPAADLPQSATSVDGELWVSPGLLTASDLTVTDFAFAADALGSASGAFTYGLPEGFVGGYTLQIDVDGDGAYDGARDRSIRLGADGSGAGSYTFDGLDAAGDPIGPCSSLNARIHFDKLGEIHILQGDVEERGGITVTRVNGADQPDSTLYWDDSALSTAGRTSVTSPLSAAAGVDSSGGVHGWEYDDSLGTNTWGNNRGIDDWAYLSVDHVGGELTIGRPCLTIDKSSDAQESARAGDTVTYTVTATNVGTGDYTATEPARVVDDLTDVLDDATFNDDTTASQDGALTYTAPKIAWEGPLASGDSVELTYTVTLKDGGDQQARNVAFAPSSDNTTDETPDCDSNDGIDPTTGEPCAFVELPLASFTVSKAASTETATPGDEVTYTVTVVNTGTVAYTEARPATFTDDLTEVLDDADYNGDATGGATFDVPVLSWAGALEVGQTKTITYSVTVNDTQRTDDRLHNAVVPGPSGSCDGACETDTPVQAFRVSKTADATQVTPGATITYQIVVENTGQVDYTTDNPASFTDDLAEVLDDAVYNADATGGATVTDGVLSWSGPLAVGATRTITYSVTVDDPDTGDQVLTNAVVTPPDSGGNCEDGSTDPACIVRVPDASFDVVKSVDTDVADAGSLVNYTIIVTNTGAADYTADAPASFTDDLSGVLDDADYNDDATGGATVDGDQLSWAGPLPVGGTATITYSVTVHDSISGDAHLRNAVTSPPDSGSSCVPGSTAPDCITITPVRSYTVRKDVDTQVADPGDVVAYSLTVTNTGAADYSVDDPAQLSDDLTDVLDDADYNDDASGGATVAEGTLTWAGPLEVGETVTITYSVTVHTAGAGNGLLTNTVTPSSPGGVCEADGCRTTTRVDVPTPPGADDSSPPAGVDDPAPAGADPGAAVHTGGHLVNRGNEAWLFVGGGWLLAGLIAAAIMLLRRRKKTD